MKRIILASLIFATALVVSCGTKGGASSAANADSTGKAAYNGKIAFIRMDTLLNQYGFAKDMRKELGDKSQTAQNDLMARGRKFEAEARDFQERAQKGLITQYQAETIGKDLQKKERELQALEQQMSSRLMEEQTVLSNRVAKAVLDYIKEYNAKAGYSMVLQTMAGNPVIIADSTMDITNDILGELNRRYLDSLSKKK